MEGKGSADLIGKGPVVNSKDEIEKLQAELSRLQKRLGAYEGPSEEKTSAEEERVSIYAVISIVSSFTLCNCRYFVAHLRRENQKNL